MKLCRTWLLMTASVVATGFNMPVIEADARRLILVRPSAHSMAAVCAHVVETHARDIKYLMAAASADAIELLDIMQPALESKKLGKVPTAQSGALRGIEQNESVDDAAARALEARDYVLRGTADGTASLIVSHESIIELILLRASDLDCEPDQLLRGVEHVPDVSVLDFGACTFPAVVATSRPVHQPQWCDAVVR